MQDNNNFETIMSKWRRLSAVELIEHKESIATASMSGDSSNHHTSKKDDESDMLMPERSGHTSLGAMSTGVGAIATSEPTSNIVDANTEEKQDSIKQGKEEHKEASCNTDQYKKRDEYLNSEKGNNSQTETKENKVQNLEKDKVTDNVDSVFLRSPPQNRTCLSTQEASTPEEDSCGIKCLYYTLQCCDCVLM